jgi:hypothetical protein
LDPEKRPAVAGEEGEEAEPWGQKLGHTAGRGARARRWEGISAPNPEKRPVAATVEEVEEAEPQGQELGRAARRGARAPNPPEGGAGEEAGAFREGGG